jgi:beta-lactam-binding protein with PASTA domain
VMVAVPDVQTLPLDQATAALNKAGLQVGNVTTRTVPGTTGGFVLSQSIPKDTKVKSNTPVDLSVAQLMVPVPHLATLPVAQAVVALQNAKLVLAGISGNQYTATVLSSSPAEGTLVNVGTPVTLTVPSNYCAGLSCYISGRQFQTNVIKPNASNTLMFQRK